jgi:motility quorum-sensing regulator / GCU-specific mRNA interferase toxin
MTTYGDASIWHDVYRPIVNGIPMYIKLTVYAAENLLVVSFKRR